MNLGNYIVFVVQICFNNITSQQTTKTMIIIIGALPEHFKVEEETKT